MHEGSQYKFGFYKVFQDMKLPFLTVLPDAQVNDTLNFTNGY